jgi:hypothetical protein
MRVLLRCRSRIMEHSCSGGSMLYAADEPCCPYPTATFTRLSLVLHRVFALRLQTGEGSWVLLLETYKRATFPRAYLSRPCHITHHL